MKVRVKAKAKAKVNVDVNVRCYESSGQEVQLLLHLPHHTHTQRAKNTSRSNLRTRSKSQMYSHTHSSKTQPSNPSPFPIQPTSDVQSESSRSHAHAPSRISPPTNPDAPDPRQALADDITAPLHGAHHTPQPTPYPSPNPYFPPGNIHHQFAMPPKRRSTGATARSTQSTLAFHGASNKVTKPATRASHAKKKVVLEEAEAAKPEVVSVYEEEERTLAQEEPAATVKRTPVQTPSTAEDEAARRVPARQVHAYWKAQNAGSRAPRYHQEALSTEEKILRKFDLTARFGVSAGAAEIEYVGWMLTRMIAVRGDREGEAVETGAETGVGAAD